MATVVTAILGAVVAKRDAIASFLFRRVEVREERRPATDGALRDRLLERTLEQLDTERMERRNAVAQLILQAGATQELERQSIDALLTMADVARRTVDVQDRTVDALRELDRTLAAFGFLLARVAFPGAERSFADIIAELGSVSERGQE
jgi:hypothetical protein